MIDAMPMAADNRDEERWKPVHIGVVFGGRSDGAVAGEVHRLRECVDQVIEQLTPCDNGNQAEVMVQFHLASDVLVPDFEGMRIGPWIRTRRCQIVQVAVPADLCERADVAEFLVSNFEQAVRLVAEQMWRFQRLADYSASQAAIVASLAVRGLRRNR